MKNTGIPVVFHPSVPKGEFIKTNIKGVPGYIFHDRKDAERILFHKENRNKGIVSLIGFAISVVLLVGMGSCAYYTEWFSPQQNLIPLPTSTPSPTVTPIPTLTPTPTNTPRPTLEPTPTREPTPTPIKTNSICTTSTHYLNKEDKSLYWRLHSLFQSIRIDADDDNSFSGGVSSAYDSSDYMTFELAIKKIRKAIDDGNQLRWNRDENKFIAPTPKYPTWTLESWKFDSRTEECVDLAKNILGIN